MTNYYIPIIYIVPLISVDGQASPRLFIAPEIRHEKISFRNLKNFHPPPSRPPNKETSEKGISISER